jgi:hypothetical protein
MWHRFGHEGLCVYSQVETTSKLHAQGPSSHRSACRWYQRAPSIAAKATVHEGVVRRDRVLAKQSGPPRTRERHKVVQLQHEKVGIKYDIPNDYARSMLDTNSVDSMPY